MQTAFMIIALAFMRDWYQDRAMQLASGKLRDRYLERAADIQKAIESIQAI